MAVSVSYVLLSTRSHQEPHSTRGKAAMPGLGENGASKWVRTSMKTIMSGVQHRHCVAFSWQWGLAETPHKAHKATQGTRTSISVSINIMSRTPTDFPFLTVLGARRMIRTKFDLEHGTRQAA